VMAWRDFMGDVWVALRQFRKSPGFAITVVLTMALGIGANTAIFTLVHATLMKSLPVADPTTLYRVGDRRTLGDGRTVIAVDGGMSDNIRPMLYDARYTVAPASRRRGPVDETVTIVGRHCESGDVLADAVALPSDVERGDLLAFAATGAYTYPLASTYNRVGRPAVVAVEDGRATVWVRREGSGARASCAHWARPALRATERSCVQVQ